MRVGALDVDGGRPTFPTAGVQGLPARRPTRRLKMMFLSNTDMTV